MRRVQAVCLTLACLAVAGCSGAEPDEPARSTPPATSAAETTEPAPTTPPPLTPDEQAAADAALAAYTGALAVIVASRRDPGAKPDWRLDYQQFMADPYLRDSLGTTYGLRDAGISAPTGEPAVEPTVSEVDLEGMRVTITDCVDTRPWPSIDATGAVVSIERPPSPVTARVYYDTQLARWLVFESAGDLEETC